VPPRRINIMFAVILAPLMFTGATQFPWAQLNNLRWFQVLCAINPLTFVSEGMRGALLPQVPHMAPWVRARGAGCVLALLGACSRCWVRAWCSGVWASRSSCAAPLTDGRSPHRQVDPGQVVVGCRVEAREVAGRPEHGRTQGNQR
jgi:hypothetical protein